MYADRYRAHCAPPRFVVGPEDWMGANLDGETDDRIVEMKTGHPRTAKAWGEPGTDSIPVYYTAQVQWYMHVRDKPRADVAALLGIDDFRIFTVEADRELQARLVETARDFWRLVHIGVPPAVTDARRRARAVPDSNPVAKVEATREDVETYNELRATVDSIKSLEGTASTLRGHLDGAHGRRVRSWPTSGRTLATWKTQSARRIDVELFAQRASRARRITHTHAESRVFRLK
jgi:predicted phage-related endonuclease